MVAYSPQTVRSRPPFERHPWDKYFYIAFAAAACMLVFLSFGPTYFFRLASPGAEITTNVHLHAVVFSAWMLLFLAQTLLVETGRTDLHVRLGVLGVVLAVGIVVVGYITAVEGARTGYLGPGNERNLAFSRMFMIVPMRDLVWFTVSFALAIFYRNTPETHKRLMLLLFIGGLMPVALGRVPGILALLIGLVFSFGPIIYDAISRKRLHRVYAIGIPLLFVPTFFLQPLAETDVWQRFADWLVG
jgi:hypothetical protein